MTNHHAVIDCHTNKMNFLFKGKTHHVFAKGDQKMEEISLNNMIEDVKNGCQDFAVCLIHRILKRMMNAQVTTKILRS